MSLILTAYPDYPTDWEAYRRAADAGALTRDFPLMSHVNLFGARYRAAKSYQGAELSGYADQYTAKGYSQLLHLILTFSAFEYYYKCVHCADTPGIVKLFNTHHASLMTSAVHHFETKVRSAETDLLFSEIRPHVSHGYHAAIDSMLARTNVHLIKLLQGMRHAFVHGQLTPNIKGVTPTTVIELCRFGVKYLMHLMDKDFSRLVR